MAMGFILGSDRVRFGKLIEDLENQHTQGIKSLPQTLTEAFVLLNNRKNNPKNQKLILGDGVAFINKGGTGSTKTKTKQNKDHITCYKCNETGHYSKQFLTNGNGDDDDEDYDNDETKTTIIIAPLPIYYVSIHPVLCQNIGSC